MQFGIEPYLLPLLLNIEQSKKGLRREKYTVESIESSVALVIARSKSINGMLEKKPVPPSTDLQPKREPSSVNAPERRTTIIAPEVIENGCVTPVGFTVVPSLVAGDVATLKIDGVPAAMIQITSGTIREFHYRIRITNTSTISVDCPGCNGPKFIFRSLALGCIEERRQSEIGLVRIKYTADTFRALVDGEHSSAVFTISGSGLNVRVTSTPATAINPFIGIKTDVPLQSKMCLHTTTPFGSRESCE